MERTGKQKTVPKSRKRGLIVQEREKAEYAKTALRILYELTLDSELTGNIRLQAANSLLDRLWGKGDKKGSPSLKSAEGDGAMNKLEALSDQELLGLIEEQRSE